MRQRQRDFGQVSDAERVETLAAFQRALDREAHVLSRDPALLWQQLYNRLQWADEPVPALLQPELKRRSGPGARPWIRTRTPFRESQALIRTLPGHAPGGVSSCAWSPDGRRVASTSNDDTIKIWDAEMGEEIHTLEGHSSSVEACAWSPDGARIVSGSRDNTLKVWDAETGEEVHTLEGHGGLVDACAWNPDGRRVVSGSEDNTLRVWDPQTGKETLTLQGHTLFVKACAWSPDGARLVSGGWDNSLRVWDADTGNCIATLPLLGLATSAAHQPYRASLACGDAGGSIYFVDLVGVTMGPIVVTAADLGDGARIRCPVCFKRYPLQEGWLGQEITCPGKDCDAELKVNPFMVKRRRGSS